MHPARIAGGIALTVGLSSLSLWLSGGGARALTYARAATRGLDGVSALDGSATGAVEILRCDGRELRVLTCSTPRAPRDVLAYYERVAKEQIAPGTPALVAEAPDGRGAIHWVTPSGVARAVHVEPHPTGQGTRYRILVDEAGTTITAAPGAERLPGGVRAAGLDGLRVVSAVVAEDGSGTAILEGPGDARGAAGRLLGALEARGFACDRTALLAVEASSGQLLIPVTHPSGTRGSVSVQSAGGRARVCLSLFAGA